MKMRILAWQRIPLAPDEQPGMPTYRLTIMIKPRTINREFLGVIDVSIEIDGRDGELENVAGHPIRDPNNDSDVWEAVMQAIADCESLTQEHMAESERYYAS